MFLVFLLGGKPYLVDFSHGKSIVLQKFKKHNIPSVNFFQDALSDTRLALSDQDVFICFILVALNSFLCPNSSTTPSVKHFGIFEDIDNAKQYDWSGYVLSWLLEHIKSFARSRGSMVKDSGTLGGCLYYLSVLYLDFVDFGHRRVPQDLPRIFVWKTNMLKTYSDLDIKSPGIYGFRPVLDVADTCYAQPFLPNDINVPSFANDASFMDKMDFVSRCKLPVELKNSICRIIESHSLSCQLNLSLDVTAIPSLPENLLSLFNKLMQHASRIDSRSKTLVLEIMKTITEYPDDHVDNSGNPQFTVGVDSSQLNSRAGNQSSPPIDNINDIDDEHITPLNPNLSKRKSASEYPGSCLKSSKSPRNVVSENNTPSSSNYFSPKLNQGSPSSAKNNSESSRVTPFRYYKDSGPQAYMRKVQSRFNDSMKLDSITNIASLRTPLADITNSDFVRSNVNIKPSIMNVQNNNLKDVIYLDNDEEYVHDSVSPVPRSCYERVMAEKNENDSDNDSLILTHSENQATVTPKLSKKPKALSANRNVSFAPVQTADVPNSPELQIIGQKSFSQSVRDMTRKSDELYNSKFLQSASGTRTLDVGFGEGTSGCKSTNTSSPQQPTFVSRASSTGGKLPVHGPRRNVKPGILFRGEYETNKNKISVSNSKLRNYKAICHLASSQFSNEDVVVLGKVRCTFWSLGESLKPGGSINQFVLSAFCYSLYINPAGRPDISKSHYFFANISDNLLKESEEVNGDVLARAFKRASRTRPFHHCNCLYFPILFKDYWSVFVVDIKDHKWVFLDSLYHKDHEYQEELRDKIVPSFQENWDRYIQTDMNFDDYDYLYPVVPQQALDNSVDSGIYAMMFLEHWKSPRTVLHKIFDAKDVPSIRVKIANDLLFLPGNSGNKHRVIEFDI